MFTVGGSLKLEGNQDLSLEEDHTFTEVRE